MTGKRRSGDRCWSVQELVATTENGEELLCRAQYVTEPKALAAWQAFQDAAPARGEFLFCAPDRTELDRVTIESAKEPDLL